MTASAAAVPGPLISVLVITYNSARFVVETLDSVASQTYERIELILSDDCSSDETLSLVSDWINRHRHRFFRVELVTVARNTGITANCNRALHAARGTWIKFIAGDDLLYPDALQSLSQFVSKHSECRVVFGQMSRLTRRGLKQDRIPDIFFLDQPRQLERALVGSGLAAPAAFLHRETVLTLGGLDESIPMIEDAPLWIRFALAGHRFFYADALVAKYRIHETNISLYYGKTAFIDLRYFASEERMIENIVIPALQSRGQWRLTFQKKKYLFVMRTIIRLGNKPGLVTLALCLFIVKSPLRKVVDFARGRLPNLRHSPEH